MANQGRRATLAELTEPLLANPVDSDDPYDTLPLPIGSFGSEDFQGGAEVRFVTLEEKTVFDKVQSRSGGVAKQRVPDGMVNMEARSPVGQILGIKVWVFREPSAAKLHQDQNGPVELQVIHGRHDIEKYYFSVNLDSVYDGPFAPVYQLAKVEMDKRNIFQLLVELSFHNGLDEETQQFYSKPFMMRSRPRNDQANKNKKRKLSGGSDEEEDSPRGDSPTSSVSFMGSAEFQHLRVIEHLDAKRAYIEHLTFKVQEAGHRKADIGYHFRLKDPNACDDFEEGDVVGFYKDDDGHSSIQLLDNKNGKDAFMAGVISRSAYLEATPPMNENDDTDVVCVIGVIQVKCIGSVRAGERIYATVDPENPGTAIPESHLPPSVLLSRSSILLGMSMQEKKASKLDDVNMVQCFVCIVLGVTDKQITSEIEHMYDQFEMDLNVKLRKERQRYRKILCLSLTVLIFVIGLAIFFLVEYLYPGSALRYMLCRKGSLDGTATFTYIPFGDRAQRCTAHGIEFTWEGLQRKLSPELDNIAPNRTWTLGKYHYYLNVDRCAYGGSLKLSATVRGISNNKQICGPIIFAVNPNCTAVYYYQDAPLEGWKRYQSVKHYPELQKRLTCKPESEFV
ncbi:unnamed protein product [Porites lobata]|uniref:Uncharacterized protein n=1 Tax=Porites lobata TaxID=104759 RepID=A0ABN8P7C9_9CNID|nr:unnamed protein product [Porites lobata]